MLVNEPTAEDTLSILRGLKARYELHHAVRISDDALVTAVRLSDRFIQDRFQPDKAIDAIDEAASRLRLQQESKPYGRDPIIPAPPLLFTDTLARREHIWQLERKLLTKKIEQAALQKEENEGSKKRLEVVEDAIEAAEAQLSGLNKTWEEEKGGIERLKETQKELEGAQ